MIYYKITFDPCSRLRLVGQGVIVVVWFLLKLLSHNKVSDNDEHILFRLNQIIQSSNVVLYVQLEYAALDAVVLVHIFHHLPGQGHGKFEWKSYIVSEQYPFAACQIVSHPTTFLYCNFSFSIILAFSLFLLVAFIILALASIRSKYAYVTDDYCF